MTIFKVNMKIGWQNGNVNAYLNNPQILMFKIWNSDTCFLLSNNHRSTNKYSTNNINTLIYAYCTFSLYLGYATLTWCSFFLYHTYQIGLVMLNSYDTVFPTNRSIIMYQYSAVYKKRISVCVLIKEC